jgi:protein Tex
LISHQQKQAVLDLFAGGATVPFIARYRKEATGGLDEVQIAQIKEDNQKAEELSKRKDTVLNTMTELGVLTDELRGKVNACSDLISLEDLYLPFKPKRKSKASVARERGLEPLAGAFMKQELNDPESYAQRFVKGEVQNVDEAILGAQHIMAEWMSERSYARNKLRRMFLTKGELTAKVQKGKEGEVKFKDYFSYSSLLSRTPGHRLLAILRGEQESVLKVGIEPPRKEAIEMLNSIFIKSTRQMGQIMEVAVRDAYMRLLRGSMETEMRQQFKEKADDESIAVFAANLDQLLMAPPVGQHTTLAIDPGFRSGCKVVCLDAQGNLKHNATVFPHPPQNQRKEAAAKISQFIEAYKIDIIAIGDGTAGRETEEWVNKDVYKKRPVSVYSVNEDGASIYSASTIAREEFPEYDVTVRGAVSIGRRLMDPLSELVKIDPKSIGVGQYQHDVDQKKLKEKLDAIVERAVNRVGVNLNLSSEHLLQHVSGLNAGVAKNIVAYRQTNGDFSSRQQLLKVGGLGPKAFEQCAGFLRITNGKNPLDNSAIHPESYALVGKMAKENGANLEQVVGTDWIKGITLDKYVSGKVGLPTLQDIASEIQKPGRDPRGEAKQFSFAEGVSSITDLHVGMTIPGKVSNITKFGAFVDIGVKQDGLVHVSKMADKYVSDPMEVVHLGQEVSVTVLELDVARKRINLSMIG